MALPPIELSLVDYLQLFRCSFLPFFSPLNLLSLQGLGALISSDHTNYQLY